MADSKSSRKRTIDSGVDGEISTNSSSRSNVAFLNGKFAQNLAKLVAAENLPLDFGDRPTFEDLCGSLNPAVKRVPAATLTRTLKLSYRKSKDDLIEELAGVKTKKRLLGFRFFQGEHTAENICRTVLSVLEEYGVTLKIFSILFDTLGSDAASIEDLKTTFESLIGGKVYPFINVSRLLSLCAQDGLQHLDLQLKPIRQAIDYLWSNPRLIEQWYEFCSTNRMNPEKFSRYVPARWDLTYLLLHKFLEYKELLSRFFTENVKEIQLLPNQWVVWEKVCDVLKSFYFGVEEISNGDESGDLLLLCCIHIATALNKYCNDEDLKCCVEAMRSRWEKHCLNLPLINLLANVFDPWTRLASLGHYLTMYYDQLIPVKDEHSPDPTLIVDNVRQLLDNFYQEYKSKYGENFTEPQPQQETGEIGDRGRRGPFGRLSLCERFRKEVVERRRKERKEFLERELENYLQTWVPVQNIHKLQWWSSSQDTYPVISRMAKEVLACPVSTGAMERTNSTGGETPPALESEETVKEVLVMLSRNLMKEAMHCEAAAGGVEVEVSK
ncbi:Unknown protein [Striga hermonthica]|uniref:HAT C-terminal dimerisation domain-containing protein n=1 Tax=Striga hermonthica TaxID=68872 RepID=A0A9N7NP60_STRHE|nr:Unknown protein [Striga hermonthica]